MREQGFTYYPTSDWQRDELIFPGEGALLRGSREFVEQFGFGISNLPPAGRMVGFRNTVRFGVDRNQEHRDQLSEIEREAWFDAYFGQILSPDLDHENPDLTTAGCFGSAMLQGSDLYSASDQFASLRDEMLRFPMFVQSDPRVELLDAQWALCMSDSGEPGWNHPEEAMETLRTAWETGVSGPWWEEFNTWDWQENPEGPGQVDNGTFRERELAIALADLNCRESMGYDIARQQIDFELQQDFVDRHQAELEAWVLDVAERTTAGRG
jgi:hypothetical protein